MSLVKPGTYQAKPIKAVHGFSAKKRTPLVEVTFEILSEGEGKGKQINWQGYMTEKTEQRTAESLMHCGWTGEDFKTLPGIGSKTPYIVIEDEKSEDGKVYSRVQWVNSGVTGVKAENQMNEAERNGFAAKMEALAKGVKAAAPKADAPAAAAGKVPF